MLFNVIFSIEQHNLMLYTVDRNKIQFCLQLIAAEFNDVGRDQWHATLSTVYRNKIQCF